MPVKPSFCSTTTKIFRPVSAQCGWYCKPEWDLKQYVSSLRCVNKGSKWNCNFWQVCIESCLAPGHFSITYILNCVAEYHVLNCGMLEVENSYRFCKVDTKYYNISREDSINSLESCATKMGLLKSLSFSYQTGPARQSFLPPASAVEVIESVPSVCVCVCTFMTEYNLWRLLITNGWCHTKRRTGGARRPILILVWQQQRS